MVASAAAALCYPVSLSAGPREGAVVTGQAEVRHHGSTLDVNQTSRRAIIEWRDFSIAPGEAARFNLPDAGSAVLNRVVSQQASSIDGLLQSNGRVFLINPNGVLIGPNGRVEAQSFVASTLDVDNAPFMAGDELVFTGDSQAAVVNLGSIDALGGDVFLIAQHVENAGSITAAEGGVGLAAGTEVLLRQSGEERITVRAGTADASVDNRGVIEATAAELRAANGNIYALAINNGGVVRATGVAERNGRIYLTADGGETRHAGVIEAEGGEVRILGDRVTLTPGSSIDVSNTSGDGGGTVLVGGDYRGTNPDITNAQETLVDFGATIQADGGNGGDGGRVIVWADGRTRFGGVVNARGGASGGDGGFVEVSGKQNLVYRGRVDVTAPAGAAGTLLLDPNDIVIANGAGASPAQSTWDDDGGGSITIYEDDLEAALGNIELDASDDLIINDLGDDELTLAADSIRFLANNENMLTNAGGVFMRDTNDTIRMTVAGADIELQGGNISTGAAPRTASLEIGDIVTNGGDVALTVKRANPASPIYIQNVTTNGGEFSVARINTPGNSNDVDFTGEGLISTGGGDVDISLVGDIDIDGGMSVGAGTLTFSGTNTNLNSTITATGNVSIAAVLNFGAGSAISTDGSITFTDTANMNPGGSLTLSGSSFDFQDTFTGNAATLTLQPNTVGGNMAINATTFENLSGFASVTLGRVDGTGTATLSGAIDVVDPFAVVMGGAGGTINQTGTISGTDDASVTYTAGGSIDIDGFIDVPAGITLTAPTVDVAAALDAGAGDMTFTTNSLAYTSTLAGTGALVISPQTNSTTIGIGAGAAGALALSAAEIANIQDGFSAITIGSATGSGDIDVRDATFNDTLTLRSPTGDGDVTVNGDLVNNGGPITVSAGDTITVAATGSVTTDGDDVTLNADQAGTDAGAIVLRGGVTTGGGAIVLQDGVYLAADLDSSTATPGRAGGDVTFNGQVLLNSGAGIDITTTGVTGDGDVTFNDLLDSGNTYALVNDTTRTWLAAEANAASGAGDGVGDTYLATVTSSLENAIVVSTAAGASVWLGGSDADMEGEWRWVTGPEGLEAGGAGRQFWQGAAGGGAVGGAYENWNGGEPNNAGNEDALQGGFTAQGYWNDLPNNANMLNYIRETNAAATDLTIDAGNVSFNALVGSNKALGDVIVTTSGAMTTAAAADAVLEGSFTHNGAGTATLGADITSSGGTITLTRATALSQPVELSAPSIATSGAVNAGARALTLTTDDLSITANVSGTDDLTIRPLSANTSIGLGNGAAGALNLTAAELAFLQDGFNSITFGRANADDIDVRAWTVDDPVVLWTAADVTINGALAVTTNGLTINSDGNVTQSAPIATDALLLLGAGTFTLNDTSNSVDRIAANLTGGNLRFDNGDALTVGSVDGTDGVTNTGGRVTIVVHGGANDLTLDEAVAGVGGASPVVLAAGRNFINNVGAAAINAGAGRFLVYSTDPRDDTTGGLVAGKLYGRTFNANPPASIAEPGDLLLYSILPTLTFRAQDKDKLVGEANPLLTYTTSGLIAGDTIGGALTGSLSLTTTATINSSPGVYLIDIGTGSLVSQLGYALNFVDATLTVMFLDSDSTIDTFQIDVAQQEGATADLIDELAARPTGMVMGFVPLSEKATVDSPEGMAGVEGYHLIESLDRFELLGDKARGGMDYGESQFDGRPIITADSSFNPRP